MTLSALENLLGGYVNQDWDLDYSDVWEAVRAFIGDQPGSVVDEARSQLWELLNSNKSEEDLKRVLISEIGCGYWPPGDGLTFRTWLEGVAQYLGKPMSL